MANVSRFGYFCNVLLTEGEIWLLFSKVKEVCVIFETIGEVSVIKVNLKGGKCNLQKILLKKDTKRILKKKTDVNYISNSH